VPSRMPDGSNGRRWSSACGQRRMQVRRRAHQPRRDRRTLQQPMLSALPASDLQGDGGRHLHSRCAPPASPLRHRWPGPAITFPDSWHQDLLTARRRHSPGYPGAHDRMICASPVPSPRSAATTNIRRSACLARLRAPGLVTRRGRNRWGVGGSGCDISADVYSRACRRQTGQRGPGDAQDKWRLSLTTSVVTASRAARHGEMFGVSW
jgi:hypothetical protein